MPFNRYTIEARFYPAVLTLPPILTLYFFALQPYLADFVGMISALVVGGVSLSIVFIYLVMEVSRFIAKLLEARYFQNELMMPTTNLLLHKDHTYSDDHKNQIRTKINREFQKELPSRSEETTDEMAARQRINEAVAMVREKVHDGRLVLQHNIHYGFARILVGGSLIACAVSVLNIIVFLAIAPNNIVALISVGLTVLYGAVLVLGKYIVTHQGNRYAKVLFQEYLAS
jgi:hypothetical protein